MHRAACIAAAVLTLAACGGGRSPYDRGDRDGGIAIAGLDGRVSVIRPGQDANAAYTEGLDLKTKGDCAGAITKLRPVANIGPGYENAQTALGLCLTTTAAQVAEPSSDYLEGLTWLRRAGDAGWPEAQGELARVHAFGPAAVRNGAESAFWLTLYQTNPSKMRIGFIPIPPEEIAAVEMSLSAADRTAGAERARKWERNVWLPSAPAEGAPGLGTGPRPRAEGRRGPGAE